MTIESNRVREAISYPLEAARELIVVDSADAVQSCRRVGKWLDGLHCKIVDGHLLINLQAAQG